MTYRDKLKPWCIIRHLPEMQRMVVARFGRRSDAEAYMKIIRQLLPNTSHKVIFDSTPDTPEQNNSKRVRS